MSSNETKQRISLADLTEGKSVRLKKIAIKEKYLKQKTLKVGEEIEGTLQANVVIGNPICFVNDKKHTSLVRGMTEDGLIETLTSFYKVEIIDE